MARRHWRAPDKVSKPELFSSVLSSSADALVSAASGDWALRVTVHALALNIHD
jgi:hypothetical protein